MKIDLNKDSVAVDHIYDVCICGAGVAGITIAIEMASRGKKVALFEGGGEVFSERSQSMYKAESSGLTYYGIAACRLRYLGGTSNHWAGRTMLLQSLDFEDRDYFPLPGWPINKKDLDVYKNKAFEILELGEHSLDDPVIPELSTSTMKMLGHGSSPPVRFGKKYYKQLIESKNIVLYINANLTDIKLNDTLSHITNLEIKNYSNKAYNFSGKKVVLAMGAIENSRLLLNCDSQIPEGIGNHSDFVGRCFMEHFSLQLGRYTNNPKHPIWARKNKFEFFPTEDFSRTNKIGTSVISFGEASSQSYGRLKAIKSALKESACSYQGLAEMSKSIFDFNCPGDGTIKTLCEQSPNINSNISLSNEKDSMGLRRVSLNWEMNALDKRTIRILAKETAKEFARLDIGRVQLMDYIINEEAELQPDGHCHQMGTTRMAELPGDGVVDKDCKVFGVDNLYIAGSSVFSTGGGVNPTLSIVQLSLRLAEHLIDSLHLNRA